MRITVLGACGAWPEAGRACSAFLVEHDGFRLLVDVGYAALPRLLEHVAARDVNAVLVSHGHPDHCADLNPLLRARALDASPPSPLPVYALPGALDAVLALDRPGMLDDAYDLREFAAGAELRIGPFAAQTRLLPHWVPNAGVRLTAGGRTLAYTGDSGPSPEVVDAGPAGRPAAGRRHLRRARAGGLARVHLERGGRRPAGRAGRRGATAADPPVAGHRPCHGAGRGGGALRR